MKALKKLILYPLCFYYAVLTPGSKRVGDGSDFYFDALFLAVMQAFIAAALFYFFKWPSTFLSPVFLYGRDFLEVLAYVGPVVGTWTFLGGIYYPLLSEILEKERSSRQAAHDDKEFSEVNRIGMEKTKYREAYFSLLKENPEACKSLIQEAWDLHMQRRGKENSNELFKDSSFVLQEVRRFNIQHD